MAAIRNIFVLLALFLFCFCACVAETCADTHRAASASYADLSAAVSAASSGDTVVVPSGTATWSSNLIITKGITLQGAGSANTIITSNYNNVDGNNNNVANYLLVYNPASPSLNEPFRLTGFTFDFNNKCGGMLLKNYSATVINEIRVDHNVVQNANGRGIQVYGTVYGVIDNNTFSGNGKHIDSYGANAISWDNLTVTFGSADYMYYEDNTFTIDTTPHSGGSGGRYVARYNTYTHTANEGLYPWFDMHGNMGAGGNWATMGAEIYGNVLTHDYPSAGVGIFDQRGGMAMIFNNKTIATSSCSAKAREEFDDSLNPTTNPQPQHVSNSYYWNNRYNTTLITAYEAQDCCDAIAENSEFRNHNTSYNGTTDIGVGCGSALPSNCTTGDGFWLTNQSCSSVIDDNVGTNPTTPISGTFYKCTATNIWPAYYTPYTYPHPLRSPSRPSNLRLIEQK